MTARCGVEIVLGVEVTHGIAVREGLNEVVATRDLYVLAAADAMKNSRDAGADTISAMYVVMIKNCIFIQAYGRRDPSLVVAYMLVEELTHATRVWNFRVGLLSCFRCLVHEVGSHRQSHIQTRPINKDWPVHDTRPTYFSMPPFVAVVIADECVVDISIVGW